MVKIEDIDFEDLLKKINIVNGNNYYMSELHHLLCLYDKDPSNGIKKVKKEVLHECANTLKDLGYHRVQLIDGDRGYM